MVLGKISVFEGLWLALHWSSFFIRKKIALKKGS